MNYKNTNDIFKSSKDDFSLFYQQWIPKGKIQRVIIFQHGFGEHSGRYSNLLKTFENTKTAFFGMDLRGHGKTKGERGHIDQFQQFIDDLTDFINLIHKKYPKIKPILLGHSLGGAIVLQALLQGSNQSVLSACVVSSAALKIKMDFGKKIKKFFGKHLSRFFPSYIVNANLDISFISHDEQTKKDYISDPLVHGLISFQMAKNLFDVGKAILQKANGIHIPIYIFHGKGDGIIDYTGSEELFEHVASKEKNLKLYEDLYHETMNEVPEDREKVLADLRKWVLNL